jgi:Arylsulfatase A and related enzymes
MIRLPLPVRIGAAAAAGAAAATAVSFAASPSSAPAQAPAVTRQDDARPNVVIIFTDDQGYGDIGVYGAKGFRTPHLDRMAQEGARFTDFYVAQPVCSASRAALLTGCYPNRIGIGGVALGPKARIGLSDNETTLAEVLKAKGYVTGAIGKWHLGHLPPFLPTRHGFDSFYGLPYSHDMWKHHPESPDVFNVPLPFYEDDRIINPDVQPADLETLTERYTERAVRFIETNRDRPFFLYLAHSLPHVPLAVGKKWKGTSEAGLYGDVIQEIDASTGAVLDALKRNGLDEKTLVVFASDNGPWLSYGDHAGSAGPLREGKGTSWDGGVRVPFLARWPGRIPAGTVCREPAMTIDILPTVANLAGAPLPKLPIDGKDIWPLLSGKEGAKSPHEALYFYYSANELQAVRSGNWKLVFPHGYRTLGEKPKRATGGIPVRYKQARVTAPELYDLSDDAGEKGDVAAKHPDVVARLTALAEKARADLGDGPNRKGAGVRPPGMVPEDS